MMKPRNFTLIAATIFGIMALVQLARAVFGWPVIIDTYAVPQWLSWVVFFIAAAMSYFGWQAYASK